MRQAILVLGMHRSGTSALTRVLSLLGATLPKNVLGGGPGNETGHWEPERLVYLHEAMLAEAGSRWNDWRKFDPAILLPPKRLEFYKAEMARIVSEEYGDAPLIVIKDPRICRFVSLYQEAFANLKIEPLYVLTLRNPLAIIESLAARDGLNPKFSSLLWLRHIIDMEAATRMHKRAVIEYERILDDPCTSLKHVTDQLKIKWPRQIEDALAEIKASLRPDLQHHKIETSNHLPETPRMILKSYDAVRSIDSLSDKARDYLDHVRAALENQSTPSTHIADDLTNFIGQAIGAELDRLHHASRMLEQKNAELLRENANLDANLTNKILHIEKLDAQLKNQDARSKDQDTKRNTQDIQLKDQDAKLKAQDAKLNTQHALLKDLSAKLKEQDDRISELQNQLNDIRMSKVWRFASFLKRINPFNLIAAQKRGI